jgi:WhiB family redox-sensing transcriptional regulator
MLNQALMNGVRLPLSDHWDWQQKGSCSAMPSEIFFFTDGERGSIRKKHEIKAKLICQTCEVISECKSFALDGREPYGIWGGLSEEDRLAIYAN